MTDWRQEYPFSSHFFEADGGVRMHYLDEGPRTDEAVVMVHGNPTWSFHFRRLVAALREHVRCVVPDHVGMGLSDKPASYPYRLEQRVCDLDRLLTSLQLRTLHLVVHDWGGPIGLGVASRRLDRIGRIVVLNSAAFPDARIPSRISACRWPLLGSVFVRGFNGFARAAVSMAAEKPLPATVRAGYLAPYSSWNDRVAVHAFIRDIPMKPAHPSYATLERIGVDLPWLRAKPILIGWGEKDFCFNLHFLERWRTIFPQAHVETYPDAGHYVLEDAADRLVPEIAGFLAGD